ncbi:MAG: fibronectin type III domain-containing protein [Elusimicrobiota bacterium]
MNREKGRKVNRKRGREVDEGSALLPLYPSTLLPFYLSTLIVLSTLLPSYPVTLLPFYPFTFLPCLYAATAANRGLTIDGNLSDWAADELVWDDSANDGSWGMQNELHKLYVSWDSNYFYIGVSGMQKDGNNLVIYIDTNPLSGISDASKLKDPNNSSSYWWWRRNNKFPDEFKPDFQFHLYQMKLSLVEGHGLFRLNSDYTTVNLNSSGVESASSGDGTAGKYAEAEVKIPWNVLFGSSLFQEGRELQIVVAMTGGMDEKGNSDQSDDLFGSAHDTIPDQKGQFTSVWSDPFLFDTTLTIKLEKLSGMSSIPRSLSVINVSTNSVTLSWNKRKVFDRDALSFNIYYSTFLSTGWPWALKVTGISADVSGSSVSYAVTGLTGSTSYFFRVTYTDSQGNDSGFSETASAITYLRSISHTAPAGFYYPGKPITLRLSVDNPTALPSSLIYYRIKGTQQWNYKTHTSTTSGELLFTLPAGVITTSGLEYYFVIYESSGVARTLPYNAPASGVFELPVTNVFYEKVPVESDSSVTIPDDGGGLTKINFQKFSLDSSKEVFVEILGADAIYSSGYSDNMPGEPVSVYEIYTKDLSGSKKSFSVSSPAYVTMRFFEDDLPAGAKIAKLSQRLAVYKWSGTGWINQNATVDSINSTVSFQTSGFSMFAIFYLSSDSQSSAIADNLERVIRPTFCPSLGESVEFIFNGYISGECVVYVYVYDLLGNKIVEIRRQGTGIDRVSWSGTNERGEIVESGVYMYQLKFVGKIISGTCAVVR